MKLEDENNFRRYQKVKINNPISYKRNGEIATVKWTPGYDTDYVTVIFDDGRSGKYHKSKLLLNW